MKWKKYAILQTDLLTLVAGSFTIYTEKQLTLQNF